jgi:hypothetical protein
MAGSLFAKINLAGPTEFIVIKFQNRSEHEKPVGSQQSARASSGKGHRSLKRCFKFEGLFADCLAL